VKARGFGPEWRWFVIVRIDTEECIGCGACVPTCPEEAITVGDEDVVAHLAEERCEGCLDCIEICPVDAIAELGEDGEPVAKAQPTASAPPPHTHSAPADEAPRWQSGASFETRDSEPCCGGDEPFSLLSWRPGRGQLRRRLRARLRGGR